MSVLADTSALYAVLDRDDAAHAAAAEALPGVLDDEPVVLHPFVLAESVALVQARLGIPAVRLFRDELLPVMRVVEVDAQTRDRALAAVVASDRASVSLVDRISFEVMRIHGLRRAFAFDRHFADEGFELVPS